MTPAEGQAEQSARNQHDNREASPEGHGSTKDDRSGTDVARELRNLSSGGLESPHK